MILNVGFPGFPLGRGNVSLLRRSINRIWKESKHLVLVWLCCELFADLHFKPRQADLTDRSCDVCAARSVLYQGGTDKLSACLLHCLNIKTTSSKCLIYRRLLFHNLKQ